MGANNGDKSLNLCREQLSIEKLKALARLENISDTEAAEVVFAIQTLTNILYDLINQEIDVNEINKQHENG